VQIEIRRSVDVPVSCYVNRGNKSESEINSPVPMTCRQFMTGQVRQIAADKGTLGNF